MNIASISTMLTVTKASAGSGKTYSLALEYIKMVLGHTVTDDNGNESYSLYKSSGVKAHGSILAITFTNKATEEMKQRIVGELDKLANYSVCEKNPYMDTLRKHFNASEQQIKDRAKTALEELLYDFDEFNISTIDSFFQDVLRTFAFEIDILDRYGLEIDDQFVLAIAIQEISKKVLAKKSEDDDSKLNQWVKDYILEKVDSGKSWNIFKGTTNVGFSNDIDIKDIASFFSKELYKQHKTAFDDYFTDFNKIGLLRKSLAEAIRSTENDIRSKFKEFGNSAKFNSNWSKTITTCCNTESFDKDLIIKKILDKKDISIEKMVNTAERMTCNTSLVMELFNGIVKSAEEWLMYAMFSEQIYSLGLFGEISKNIEEFRKDNSLILLSDTNDLLHKIISDEDVPFIYERMGTYLKHFLIDEFQDTSRMQWENMLPLVKESLSKGEDNLIIGDEKQSIYRFRNADPSLLQTAIFKELAKFIPDSCKKTNFSTNYRSAKDIVCFNNSFFTLLADILNSEYESQSAIADTYRNVVQYVSDANKNKKGYVEISFQENIHELSRVKNIIEDAVSRGYHPKDIAILTNTKNECAEVVRFLTEAGIQTISDEALYLKNCPSIDIIINVLRNIDSGQDKENGSDNESEYISGKSAKINMLKIFNTEINNNKANENFSYSDALKKAVYEVKDSLSHNNDGHIEIAKSEDLFDLYSIVEQVIKEYISPDAYGCHNAYISAFQDIILDYSAVYPPTIKTFLRWWDNNNPTLPSSNDIDAVSIMTIHKSKGLEYPIVIIPMASWNLKKEDKLLWISPEKLLSDIPNKDAIPPLMPVAPAYLKRLDSCRNIYDKAITEIIIDNLNKTYVAFTRAERELYIIAPKSENGSKRLSDSSIDKYIRNVLDCDFERLLSIVNPDLLPDKDSLFTDLHKDASCCEEHFHRGEKTTPNDSIDKISDDIIEMPVYSPMPQLSEDIPTDQDENSDDARHTGIRYHCVLNYIKTAADIDKAVAKAWHKHQISYGQQAEVKELLHKVLSQSEPATWFSPGNKIINERPIFFDGKQYRADRIIIHTDGTAIVIDYKFGEENSKYASQIKKYATILRKCGLNVTEGKIWYPLTGKISTIEIGD